MNTATTKTAPFLHFTAKCISFFEEHPNIVVSFILFFALILRICALLNYKNTIYYNFLIYDESVYHN